MRKKIVHVYGGGLSHYGILIVVEVYPKQYLKFCELLRIFAVGGFLQWTFSLTRKRCASNITSLFQCLAHVTDDYTAQINKINATQHV